MAIITQAGSINTAAIVVPDLYVQIVPPQQLVLNGVPTNIIGLVGSASWGPVNVPTIIGAYSAYVQNFGPVVARTRDMGTILATAVQQGSKDYRCVRVTDGTDTASTATMPVNSLALTARYTGSLGNQIVVSLSVGSRANTLRAVVGLPGLLVEVFDNLPADATFWAAFSAAVTNGLGLARGPSAFVTGVVSATPTAIPVVGSFVFAGGTDGAAITDANLLGTDPLRSGMYALRGSGVSILVLADCTDSTRWTEQAAYGLAEGAYMICVGTPGQTISAAVATKQAAGLDNYAVKLLLGDYLFWNDTQNGVTRLVSPQGFVAGRLGNLSPEQSSLNKEMFSIAGSQKSGIPGSGQSMNYSGAELQVLGLAGIDVVCNPIPRGAVWGARFGHNSSTDATVRGDNYTRMTNFVSRTLAAGMGRYVGETITNDHFLRIRSTLLSFFGDMLFQGILGLVGNSLPYSVVTDLSNNPFSRTSQGYVQADIQVTYLAINERFLVNLEGGQTVSVRRIATTSAAS